MTNRTVQAPHHALTPQGIERSINADQRTKEAKAELAMEVFRGARDECRAWPSQTKLSVADRAFLKTSADALAALRGTSDEFGHLHELIAGLEKRFGVCRDPGDWAPSSDKPADLGRAFDAISHRLTELNSKRAAR